MSIIYSSKPLPKRRERDYYPTEPELVRAALKLVPSQYSPRFILDPGCGTGIWGAEAKILWPQAAVVGVDIEPDYKPGLLAGAFNAVFHESYIQDGYEPRFGKFDLIIGNPPYNLAEEFVRQSWASLSNGGLIIFLFRLSFLASRTRAEGLYKDLPLKAVHILVTRPSFTGDGKSDNSEYGLFIWKRPLPNERPCFFWYDWKAV